VQRVVKFSHGQLHAGVSEHPAVINGCSELFREVFGEETASARAAPWAWVRLPGNISVEIEAIFELHERAWYERNVMTFRHRARLSRRSNKRERMIAMAGGPDRLRPHSKRTTLN